MFETFRRRRAGYKHWLARSKKRLQRLKMVLYFVQSSKSGGPQYLLRDFFKAADDVDHAFGVEAAVLG